LCEKVFYLVIYVLLCELIILPKAIYVLLCEFIILPKVIYVLLCEIIILPKVSDVLLCELIFEKFFRHVTIILITNLSTTRLAKMVLPIINQL